MMRYTHQNHTPYNMTAGYDASMCTTHADNTSQPESFQITALMYLVPGLAMLLFVSFGNILVFLAVRKFTELHTSANIFVVNLAIADLSVGLLVLPLHLFIFVFPVLKSVFLVCMLRYAWIVASTSVSGITLVLISIDRYIAIEKPYSHTTVMTRARSKSVCIGVWVLALTYAVLPLLGWNHWTPCSECTFSVVLPTSYITTLMVGVIVSIVVIGILNAKLFITANAISRDILNQVASVAGQSNHINARNVFLRNTKAAKALFMVFGVFGVCTLPFTIFTLWETYALKEGSREIYNVVRLFTSVLGIANSGMNPVIYHRKMPQFNTAFRKLLGMKRRVEPTVR